MQLNTARANKIKHTETKTTIITNVCGYGLMFVFQNNFHAS